jgi:hypothetical protein
MSASNLVSAVDTTAVHYKVNEKHLRKSTLPLTVALQIKMTAAVDLPLTGYMCCVNG